MRGRWGLLLAGACAVFRLAAEDPPEYRTVPAAEILTPAADPPASASGRDWHRSHGDESSSRYSTLDEINRGNVKRLQVAWIYHSGDGKGNIQSNPVIVGGVMYAPTVGNFVVAVDAATGREKWRFKPEGKPVAQRGLVHWPGDATHPPRLFFPAGKYLYALDAASGKAVAGFGRDGRVPAEGVVAPAIYRRVIVIPCWNQVQAFDVIDGKPLWTFHVIPREDEFGHETWSRPGHGAGSNIWGGMALDTARGIAYVSTGSPHPNFIGVDHRGSNLFANCVIALRAETGERLWHFQEIRHDIWDLDIPAPPNLVTVTRNGRKYDAVAQVTKLGNTLLLDRLTGKPLFPFRLRRAPASNLPGEETAPYQPDVELPQPFARQVFTRADVTDISPQSQAFVLEKIAGANFGWFAPFEEGKPTVFYGIHGGAEWTGAAFDPANGWLYVSANELPWSITVSRGKPHRREAGFPATRGREVYLAYCVACHGSERQGRGMAPPLENLAGRLTDPQIADILNRGRNAMPAIPLPEPKRKAILEYLFDRDISPAELAARRSGAPAYIFDGYNRLLDQDGLPGCRPPWGTLNAIDLSTGRIAWKVPLGEYDELTRRGIPKTGTENFGGAIVTAGGLVFCGGTRDLKIRAFDSRTGEELWHYKLPYGGFAPPATYEAGGRQYVVIPATGGGKLGGQMGDAYVAFALPVK